MVVAGNVDVREVEKLSKKWFGPIPSRPKTKRNLPVEPSQKSKRTLHFEGNVPQDAIYKTFHMPGRFDNQYYAVDLTSDILGRGKSSRLYDQLVRENKMFSNIQAYVTGSIDPGLLVISGHINPGTSMEKANEAIDTIIDQMKLNQLSDGELTKVKNQAESSVVFNEIDMLNKAINIAFGASNDEPDMINQEAEKIRKITVEDISNAISNTLMPENSSTLFYHAKK